ncbi:MAG: hypothetical protein JSS49_20560 [Planctomycetes bacterium]|nr:hypothetical protein [Planctomycetota bacterium]
MNRVIPIAFAVLSPLISAAADPQNGDTVFVKSGAEATRNQVRVEIKTIPAPATVLKVRGNMLQIAAETDSGDDASVWIRKSHALTGDQALKYYSDQIQQQPANPKLWLRRSLIWRELNKPTEAINDATEAIRLDPQSPAGYMHRGLLCRRLSITRQQDTSFDDFSEVIRLHPTDGAAHAWRAYGWDEKGDIDNAINDYTTAIRLGDKTPSNYFYRGYYSQQNGDFGNAIKDFTEAIRLDQTRGEFYIGLAWLKATCPDEQYRDGRSAVEAAKRACELPFGKGWKCLDTLAAAYAEYGDFENALKTMKQAVSKAPSDRMEAASARLKRYESGLPHRDWCMYQTVAWRRATSPVDHFRNGTTAREFAVKACELTQWKEWSSLDALATAYAELGDFANATKWGEKALKLAPEDKQPFVLQRLTGYRADQPYRDGPHPQCADTSGE